MIIEQPKGKSGESQHWYTRDGQPMHQIPYKDKNRKGELRNATLADARQLNLLPSVSGILGIMAKKGLDNWMKEQVARAAYSVWQTEDYVGDQEAFTGAVLDYAETRMTRARDLGTEIHGAIERYLKQVKLSREDPEASYMPSSVMPHSSCVEATVAALRELGVWGQPFEAERTFASPLGYGGTIDFQAELLVADFKCVDRMDKKLAYEDRCAQLCAYFMGNTNLPKYAEPFLQSVRLVNIFISTSEPGKYLIHEWSQEDKEHGWRLFRACQALWEISNNYYPSREISGTATQ